MNNPMEKFTREEEIPELNVEQESVISAQEAKQTLDAEFKSYEQFLSPIELQALKTNIEAMFRNTQKGEEEMTKGDLNKILEESRRQLEEKIEPEKRMKEAEMVVRRKEAESKLKEFGINKTEREEQDIPESQPTRSKKSWWAFWR